MTEKSCTRRSAIKLATAAAAAGIAAGSGAVTGFPTIWAQTIKDITLKPVRHRHVEPQRRSPSR